MQIRAFGHYALSSVPQIVDQAEDSTRVRRQSRTDCTSINMRYTPHGIEIRAVQRNTMNDTLTHPSPTVSKSIRTRARAAEIVCTLYRCTPDEASALLIQLSQTNNLKIASLIRALVAIVDDTSAAGIYGNSDASASHFWLREIRELSKIHRRSDHFERHFATPANRCAPLSTAGG
ncbi:hypothetical protein ABH922_004207 [Rhodococcus sp. 27YEA15]|uniref:hypothetical protein n=1 Tax=Rhodococcus sp. 27YEA15 TaxID=3156259 RepID=UPI003C7B3153